MGRKRQAKALFVLMNGRAVGQLTKNRGILTFQYDSAWLESEAAVPLSLSIPLSAGAYRGNTVYRFFDNLLPDSGKIRDRMQVRLQTESTDAFDLLAAAGADCIGAIQLVRSLPAPSIKRMTTRAISAEEIADILRDYRNQPLGMTPEDDEFRISLAGQQEKSAFLWHEKRWKRPFGTTPTSHIFKLPIGRLEPYGIDLLDSIENEWLCLKIAKEFGLSVPDAHIVVFAGLKVLVVERFDRIWAKDSSWLIRIPQEDFCQALDYSQGQKYESDGGPGIGAIMKLLLQSMTALEDRVQFMRSQVLFWLMAAPDGHAKNFSIQLHPGGRFRLAPFYDIISAYPILARGDIQQQRLKLAMAVLGRNRHYRWATVQSRHWISTAKRCGFPVEEMETILREFAEVTDQVVSNVQQQLPNDFPEEVARTILHGLTNKCRSISQ